MYTVTVFVNGQVEYSTYCCDLTIAESTRDRLLATWKAPTYARLAVYITSGEVTQ